MLKLERNCKNCEFNFDGICASSNYGMIIKNFEKHRNCWEMGFEQFCKTMDILIEINSKKEVKEIEEELGFSFGIYD